MVFLVCLVNCLEIFNGPSTVSADNVSVAIFKDGCDTPMDGDGWSVFPGAMFAMSADKRMTLGRFYSVCRAA